jgi:diguanylate cyclase (GGDEF)-like protein
VIADILEMLEVRASDALPAWLAARVKAGSPEVRTRVLRVFPARAARIKGGAKSEAFTLAEGDSAPRPVAGDPLMQAALRGRAPVTAPARLLAPFEALGEVRHVVEFAGHLRAPDAATDLIAVARSYYERLVEGETDTLTHLANRRLFQSHVEAGVRQWVASGRGYYFAMLDLDRFKRINDDFGHLYGDEILVHFANVMRATFRSGDLLYRFGGEEFVVIFGVDPPERAGDGTLERFRAAVENYDFPGVGRVTVSIGFTAVADMTTPAALLIDRADEALYYAKEHGRNRVCCWEKLVAAGEIVPKAVAKKDVTLF